MKRQPGQKYPGVKVGKTLKGTISKEGVDPNPLKCCICGESVAENACEGNKAIGWLSGNNPQPLGEDGDRACDSCNSLVVLPARFIDFLGNRGGVTNLLHPSHKHRR